MFQCAGFSVPSELGSPAGHFGVAKCETVLR